MDAAVVKFNPLTNAYRPAADDYRLIRLNRLGLVLLLIGTVEIGGAGVKLGGTGIDYLVDRANVPAVALFPYLLGQPVSQGSDLPVGKPQPLGLPHKLRRQCFR